MDDKIIIPGVNVEKGLAQLGGRMASYLKILGAFHQEGSEKIASIEKSYNDGDIGLLTIFVHGAKSAAANIGAEELSAACYKLEEACNIRDMATIDAWLPPMLADFRVVLAGVSEVIAKNHPAGNSGDMKKLASILTELCDAFENYNMSAIKIGCDALVDFAANPDFGKTIDAITYNRTIGEYEAAAEHIKTLLNRINQ